MIIRKPLFVFFFLLLPIGVFSQKVIIDTVSVNKNNVVHLLFKNKIVHANPNNPALFHLEDNDKRGKKPVIKTINNKYVVFLKARKRFEETNLVLFDDKDNYYKIVVKYDESSTDTFYPIDFDFREKSADYLKAGEVQSLLINPDDEDINIPKIVKHDSLKKKEVEVFYKDTIHYKTAARLLYADIDGIKRIKRYKKKGGLVYLKLLNTYSIKDYSYVVFEVENNNSIPYEIDRWEFYISDKREKKLCNSPICMEKPIFTHDARLNKVLPSSITHKIFVFKRLSLAPYQGFIADMIQKDGNNHIRIEIEQKYINRSFLLPKKYIK